MDIAFYGAAQTVTGSKHVLIFPDGYKLMLDCGLFQGLGDTGHMLNRYPGFKPAEIDAIVLSHAHIDHSGLIPFMVKNGFKGYIYATPATIDLCEIMLRDSAKIQTNDIRFINKKRQLDGLIPYKALYSEQDALTAMYFFKPLNYGQKQELRPGLALQFEEAGHILGSAVTYLHFQGKNGKKQTLCYTSDVGRNKTPLIKPPAPILPCDFLILESTYGSRLHANLEDTAEELLSIILETCLIKKGKLIIPAFSLGRTQEIIFYLDKLQNQGRLPAISIYVDSPLSVNATEIFKKHAHELNHEIQQYMQEDPDPFGFSKLFYITKKEDSQRINELPEPCVIISASGMADAGRVKHHLKHNIGSIKNSILLVGYCEPQSLGAKLAGGAKHVQLWGKWHDVKAEVFSLPAFSAHADYGELINWISPLLSNKPKQIFLVHGVFKSQEHLKGKLLETGFENIYIPFRGEKCQLIS